MKLSFSIKGWERYSWADYVRTAKEMELQGIELRNIHGTSLTARGGPFHAHMAAATLRELYEAGLSLPCIDAVCDIADAEKLELNCREIADCIETARQFKIPNIRVHATSGGEVTDALIECLRRSEALAMQAGVTVLIETVGIFADTGRLRDVLNGFASDYLAVLWDFQHPYRVCGETPDQTIQNLGAYVRHVHVRDSVVVDGNVEPRLVGEGDMPLATMMNALRSVNYDGFLSLEWDPAWMPEIDDLEVILPHYVNYMTGLHDPYKTRATLYDNAAHTGKFPWKKELIIDQTFPQVLDRMVEEFPDQYAFKFTTLDYTRTYSQFRDDVDQFARALITLGVKKGDKVAIWATNVPAWYLTFWATTKIGAILVTMNTAYKIHEAEYLLRQSDTHTLVMIDGYRDSNYAGIIAELCPELAELGAGKSLHAKRLPFLRHVITVGYRQKGCLTWEEAQLYAAQTSEEELRKRAAAVDKHDVCNMQYTSGTTGFPKGVMLTHYNVVNNGKAIGDCMDLSTADRMMIQVPMFHCFGMVLAMTASMTHGATLHPLPYFSPKSSLSCINSEHVTCFHGVPTMFIAMLNHEDFPKTDFSYMRTGIMAGSPCPIKVMEEVVEKMHMPQICITYGQTEASPATTMSHTTDSLETRVNTVGSPIFGVECKIVDPETGEELGDDQDGEFCARGYNIMKGYYKMPEATAKAIDEDGWLHSGDLLRRLPDGNYKVTGRLKDMIIRGGENLYPKEIEDFLYTHPDVEDVQVIGVPDAQYGEEAMACVIPREGSGLTEEILRKFCMERIAKHKVPRYFRFVDAFPMNAAGKILKYKMREEAVELLKLQDAEKIVTA
jgi:fatty-acyl-CoA synthase